MQQMHRLLLLLIIIKRKLKAQINRKNIDDTELHGNTF